jgi:two-component system, cell cycle sensor histidine kinase and response regulator CckA
VNSSITSIWGYTPQEFMNLNVFPDMVHPDDHILAANLLDQVTHTVDDEIVEGEYRIRHKEGHWQWLKTREVVFSRDGEHLPLQILGVAEDVTERRQLEAQLLHAQKMEAAGRLAGGVAHDFNNLLTIINGYGELLLKDVEQDLSIREKIEAIVHAGAKAEALTNQLLAFSRKQIIKPSVINMNEQIEENIHMMGRLIGEDIKLTTNLAPNVQDIMFDPGQFHQIIMNLVVNARDAMHSGGDLQIETEFEYLDDAFCQQHLGARKGYYNRLRVIDSGVGMDEDTRSQIFEPFFTTKGPDKGTGLGLSMVYGIVKQNNGNLWVDSKLGEGTTFSIYIPPITDSNQDVVADIPDEKDLSGGTETLLIVEDDAHVRQLMVLFLVSGGYSVLEASNGNDALAIFKRYKDQIDLVITDVAMPGMDGKKLAEKLIQYRPRLKIMFVSGYISSTPSQDQNYTEIPVLEKPFTQNILSMKVRQVLNKDLD